MAEKMLPLVEAFRTILRARYSSRPALADEVHGYDFFRPDEPAHPVEEVQAALAATEALKDAIASQSVRLRGWLNGAQPADIDPTEIIRNGIGIFENILEVWQPSTRSTPFRMLRTYRNVHCYAADVGALVADHVRSDAPRKLSVRAVPDYVAAYLLDNLNPSIERLRERAKAEKIKGGRTMLDAEYHKQMALRGVATGPGRRRKAETQTN
jgi:hypothetical protein